ncbi:citrate synthase [Candidatus Nitrosacidococcus tergens]|uniref:Citrate synthase n=1 Tax=Candidatus Nitrosacidococcus tergens TaxID=553981 RepID=A0A7G1QBI9_9GAMM|nr:citrate synthase [Candidatus Nitrosacidococcus tergens]CAB1277062.1 Citrate synthase [Candidatus Nitrosacidococcus tergens]
MDIKNNYSPGLEGIPAIQSSISNMDGKQGSLFYRGYPIEELACYSTFEEVIFLLLSGELPTESNLTNFVNKIKKNYFIPYYVKQVMEGLPKHGSSMAALQTGISSLGVSSNNYNIYDFQNNEAFEIAIKIIGSIPTIAALWDRTTKEQDFVPPRSDLAIAQNFLYMLHGKVPDPHISKILDTCLILHAEHTINASTFATLVTGSTLANPYSVISAAIGTLSGPLHGGANEQVIKMLTEIGSPENVTPWLDMQLQKKQKIWGFGHRIYKVKDPRAKILQDLITQLTHQKEDKVSQILEIAFTLEQEMTDRMGHKNIYPNVDFYSGILYTELGIPTTQFTPLFAIARSAGWLAHWLEQRSDNRIFRPTQIYVGNSLQSYIPLDKR